MATASHPEFPNPPSARPNTDRPMRIEQLEYIAAITEHGSLRRASEHLHISQSALSESITRLERELGVALLDRHRSGARISIMGRELLQPIVDVLESVDRLKAAAGDQLAARRTIRVGTVNAGTAALLLPAMHRLQRDHPGSTLEVRSLQQGEIEQALVEGTLDVGLVNLLDGDDTPPGLGALILRVGRPVVVLPTGHPLAECDEITIDQLRAERFVAMRSGYIMHRFAHRLFGSALPATWNSTDGAEMGKMMVAERIGVTVLPDYSVTGDPLERTGLIVSRPIAECEHRVRMVAIFRPPGKPHTPLHELIAQLRTADPEPPTVEGRAD